MGQLAKATSVPALWMLGFREGLDNSRLKSDLGSTDEPEVYGS